MAGKKPKTPKAELMPPIILEDGYDKNAVMENIFNQLIEGASLPFMRNTRDL